MPRRLLLGTMLALLIACAHAGCGNSKKTGEERARFAQRAADQLQAAKSKADAYDFARANAILSDLVEEVRESPFPDVATYDKMMAEIAAIRREVSRQKASYRKKIRAGWKMLDGQLVSLAEQRRARAQEKRRRENDRRKLEEETKQKAEERRAAEARTTALAEEQKFQEQAKAKLQQERKQFIQKLMDQGYWLKTESTGSLPYLWVTQKFLLSDEISQNKTLSVVYAYWVDELDNFGDHGFYWDPIVLKLDTGTSLGRRIGTYDPVDGIRIK